MAIPIYKGKQIKTDVSSAQVGIAQDVQQDMSLLSKKLGQFAGTLRSEQIKKAQIDAGNEASKLFADGGNSRRLREDNGYYNESFNRRMSSLMFKQTNIDATSYAKELYDKHEDNPLGFQEAFGAYKKKALENAPESLRGDLSVSLASIESASSSRLQSRYFKKQKEREKTILDNSYKFDLKNLSDFNYEGNFAQSATTYNFAKTSLDAQLSDGLIDEKEYKDKLSEIQYTSIRGSMMGINDRLLEKKDFVRAEKNINDFAGKTHKDISVKQRESIEAKLRQDLSRARSLEGGRLRASDQALKHNVNEAVKMYHQGKFLANIGEITREAEGTKYEQELHEASRVYNAISAYVDLPPKQLEQAIIDIRKQTKGGTTEGAEVLLKRLGGSLNKDKALLKKSPLQVALNHGYIDELAPLDTSSPENFKGSLMSRIDAYNKTYETYGVVGGAFSDTELTDLAGRFPNMTIDNRQSILESISTLQGLENARKIPKGTAMATFKQLNKKGWGEFSIAGALSLEGEDATSEMILNGTRLKSAKEYKKPKGFNLTYQTELGNALTGMDATQTSLRDSYFASIESVYAILAKDSEDAKTDIDEGLLNKAIKQVTGGTYRHNNSTLIMPVHGMSEDDFEEWFDNIGSESILGINDRVNKNISDEDFIESLKEDFQIVNLSKGVYGFKSDKGILRDSLGNPIRLSYTE